MSLKSRTSNHPKMMGASYGKIKSYKKGGVIEGGPTPDEYAAEQYDLGGLQFGIEGGSIPTDARGYPVRLRGTSVGGNVQFPIGDLNVGVGFDASRVRLGPMVKKPGGLSEVSIGVPFAGGDLSATYGRRREEGEVDRRFTIEFSKKF